MGAAPEQLLASQSGELRGQGLAFARGGVQQEGLGRGIAILYTSS